MCEEYTGGQFIGAATNGELCTGIISSVIIGIKQNTPYSIKSALEIKIHADWLKNQIFGCLKDLLEIKIHADWLKNQIFGCLKDLTDCEFISAHD